MRAYIATMAVFLTASCAAQSPQSTYAVAQKVSNTKDLEAHCSLINYEFVIMMDKIIADGRQCLSEGAFSKTRESCRKVVETVRYVDATKMGETAVACVKAGYIGGMDRPLEEADRTAREATAIMRTIMTTWSNQ